MAIEKEGATGLDSAGLAILLEQIALQSLQMGPLVLGALERRSEQAEAYQTAKATYGEKIPEAVAVSVATHALRRAMMPLTHTQEGADFQRGLIAARAYAREALDWKASDIRRAIEDAKTSEDAYLAVKFMCIVLLSRLDGIPDLRMWHGRMLGGLEKRPVERGRKSNLLAHRDQVIADEIEHLRDAGFRPTRNAQPSLKADQSRRVSGCDVVKKALAGLGMSLSYKAIETVWLKRQRGRRPS